MTLSPVVRDLCCREPALGMQSCGPGRGRGSKARGRAAGKLRGRERKPRTHVHGRHPAGGSETRPSPGPAGVHARAHPGPTPRSTHSIWSPARHGRKAGVTGLTQRPRKTPVRDPPSCPHRPVPQLEGPEAARPGEPARWSLCSRRAGGIGETELPARSLARPPPAHPRSRARRAAPTRRAPRACPSGLGGLARPGRDEGQARDCRRCALQTAYQTSSCRIPGAGPGRGRQEAVSSSSRLAGTQDTPLSHPPAWPGPVLLCGP